MVGLEVEFHLHVDLIVPGDWVQTQFSRNDRMWQVERAWRPAVTVALDLVAAVPTNEGSVLVVFELDDVASDPALRVALGSYLEDDLRTAVSHLDGDVLVEL